jgi:hypothetical protein
VPAGCEFRIRIQQESGYPGAYDISGYLSQGPFCNGSVALAVTDPSEEQRVITSPNIISPTRHLSGSEMINVDLEPETIVEGIDHQLDVSMGDVEVLNEPCSINSNLLANTNDNTETGGKLPEIIAVDESSHPRDGINNEPSDSRSEDSWEADNTKKT